MTPRTVADWHFEPGQELIIETSKQRQRVVVRHIIHRTEQGSVMLDVERRRLRQGDHALRGHGWRYYHHTWTVRKATQ